jgi:hypothetical protein
MSSGAPPTHGTLPPTQRTSRLTKSGRLGSPVRGCAALPHKLGSPGLGDPGQQVPNSVPGVSRSPLVLQRVYCHLYSLEKMPMHDLRLGLKTMELVPSSPGQVSAE